MSRSSMGIRVHIPSARGKSGQSAKRSRTLLLPQLSGPMAMMRGKVKPSSVKHHVDAGCRGREECHQRSVKAAREMKGVMMRVMTGAMIGCVQVQASLTFMVLLRFKLL